MYKLLSAGDMEWCVLAGSAVKVMTEVGSSWHFTPITSSSSSLQHAAGLRRHLSPDLPGHCLTEDLLRIVNIKTAAQWNLTNEQTTARCLSNTLGLILHQCRSILWCVLTIVQSAEEVFLQAAGRCQPRTLTNAEMFHTASCSAARSSAWFRTRCCHNRSCFLWWQACLA